jgi:putative ATP-binding cassette transporter
MKNLLQLVKAESEGVRQKILVSTAIAGLSQAAILATINQAAQTASYDGLNFRYLMMFAVALALYVICQQFSSSEMIRITTEIVEKIRLRLGEKIQRSELTVLEKIGKAPILNAMSHEASIISDCGDSLISGLQAAIFVVFAFVYIAYLSMPAFVLTVVCSALAIAIVQRNRAEVSRLSRATKAKEIEFLNYVTHAIDGFKETKLNERKRVDVQQDVRQTAKEVKELL